jgi:hypothetical protein
MLMKGANLEKDPYYINIWRKSIADRDNSQGQAYV